MRLVSRFLLQQLVSRLLLALGVLVLALLLSAGPRWLQPFQRLAWLSPESLRLVGWLLLSSLSTLLPLAWLLGGLLTLSTLRQRQSLLVLEGLGLPPAQLWRPLGVLTVLLALLLPWLSLEVEPVARQQARRLALELEARALSEPLEPGVLRILAPGVWLQALTSPAPQPTLLLTDARDPAAPLSILARRVAWESNPQAQAVRLTFLQGEVRQLSGDSPETWSYTRTSFERLELSLPLLTPGVAREVTELTQEELRLRIQETLARGEQAVLERLTLWRRWGSPLWGLGAGLMILPLARWSGRGRLRSLQAWGMALGLLLVQVVLIRVTEGMAHGYPGGVAFWALLPGVLLVMCGGWGLKEVGEQGVLGAGPSFKSSLYVRLKDHFKMLLNKRLNASRETPSAGQGFLETLAPRRVVSRWFLLLTWRGLLRCLWLTLGLTVLATGWELLERQRLLLRQGVGLWTGLELVGWLALQRLAPLVGLAGMLSAWIEARRLVHRQELSAWQGLGGHPGWLLLSVWGGIWLGVVGLGSLSEGLAARAQAELTPWGLQTSLGGEERSAAFMGWQWEGEQLTRRSMEPAVTPRGGRAEPVLSSVEWFLWRAGELQQHVMEPRQEGVHPAGRQGVRPGWRWEKTASGEHFLPLREPPTQVPGRAPETAAPFMGLALKGGWKASWSALGLLVMLGWQTHPQVKAWRRLVGGLGLLVWLLVWLKLGAS